MKLYRGDSIPSKVRAAGRADRGRTFAEHICGAGLMAKFADEGSGDLLRERTLLDIVLAHVGYLSGTPEEKLSYRSPLISFTEDESHALAFANRSGRKALVKCSVEDASHFVWMLDIDLPKESAPGHYRFEYRASSVNCHGAVNCQIEKAARREAKVGDMGLIPRALMNWAALQAADNDPRNHSAELINVVTFIEGSDVSRVDPQLVARAKARASRSSEWLLYPTSPMDESGGISSRFAMNRHLHIYTCLKERGALTRST